MKKHITVFILTGALLLSLPSCAKRETVDFDNIMDIKTETSQEEEFVEESDSITNMETETFQETESIEENYDIVDQLKENIKSAEESAASLEKSISNDLLTQTEYNEKTQELYEVWDSALNTVWSTLKQTQDADTMNRLTDEEREWIALKEQAAAQAGAEYEGGTMQSMVMNQKAAEMTKARVYELMELFEVSEEKTAGAETSAESAADYSGSRRR
ncbi:MAG: DUF1311 domain-containing protein [Lachnospiraceae bacterium]|nr:DUF1311 domain-containing protein [Lachnospiraceae bacterium]